jgi:hypothetical protein
MRRLSFISVAFLLFFPVLLPAKELPKIAVWDLEARNTPDTHAKELTSILVSEIAKLKIYEVYITCF